MSVKVSRNILASVVAIMQCTQVYAVESKRLSTIAPAVPVAMQTSCVGLLCHLTPNSMARPLSAAEAAELEARRAQQSNLNAPAFPKRPRSTHRYQAARMLALAQSRIKIVDARSLQSRPDLPDQGSGAKERAAIFSLVDPVAEPADYLYWLRRVPPERRLSGHATGLPYFASN